MATNDSWDWTHTLLICCTLFVFTIVANTHDLYESWRVTPAHFELSSIWRSWLLTITGIVFLLYLGGLLRLYDRSVLTIWLLLTPAILTVTRFVSRLVLRSIRWSGHNFRSVAVLGATQIGGQIARCIRNNPWMGLQLVGFFDDRKPGGQRPLITGPSKVAGNITDLIELARDGKVDVVYISLPMRSEARIKKVLNRLSDTTASVYFVPDFTVFELLHARWETLGRLPVIRIVDTPFHGVNGWAKRLQDIILSSLILACISLPMLIIAIAIKLTSPGPIIFRQIRYGLDGKEFEIYKFRTMNVCEDRDDFKQTTRNDPRVTRLGEILRKTSLDELPQFINVLQGRMSIVGPRPHPVKLNEQHRHLVHRYMLRHKVRPGITGWAQIHGYRGETDALDKMEKRLQYDLEYIDNYSIWLDLIIILTTLVKGFYTKNAY